MTIKHSRGSITVNSEPQRVVTLGWSDQDPVGRALGQQAKDLIKHVEGMFAKVRAEHPEWADQSALVMAKASSGDIQLGAEHSLCIEPGGAGV